MTSRRLVIVRHAKAERYAGNDHQRSLTGRGKRAAVSVGRWLADQGVHPDYALVSSATRTQQTWAGIRRAFEGEIHQELSDALYGAGPEQVIDAVRWVPVEARTVVYVGHNPTAGELPHLLDDGSGTDAALTEIAMGFPTGAVAVMEVADAWADLQMGRARLTSYFVGQRD